MLALLKKSLIIVDFWWKMVDLMGFDKNLRKPTKKHWKTMEISLVDKRKEWVRNYMILCDFSLILPDIY